MSITIGDAILWLRGKDDKLDGDLKDAEGKAQGWLNRLGGRFKESMNFAMGQVMAQGIDTMARGIENLASEVIDLGQTYAQQVEDIARLSGASVEDASRIIQVADDMRLSYEQVSTAMKMYARQAAESGEAADMSIETLARLSDQYLELAPGVERTNFLLENFGRSGADMGKLMEQGGDGIRSMAGAVDESLVMTEEGIQAAEDYRLAMDEWNDSMDGIKLQFAQALLPALSDFASFAQEILIPAMREIVGWFVALPEPARNTVIAVGGLFLALVKLGPMLLAISGFVSMLGGGGAAAGAAGAAGGGGLLAALGAALAAVSAPVWLLIAAIGALIAVIVIFGKDAANTLSMIGLIWMAAWQRMWSEVSSFGTKLLNWAIQVNTQVRTWFKRIGTGIVEGIWAGIKERWEWLKTQISANMKSLLAWVKTQLGIKSPSLVFAAEIGAPMALGIGQGFSQAMRADVFGAVQAGVMGMTQAGASAGQTISIGRVENHGRFSSAELGALDRRSERIAEKVVLQMLEGRR